MNTLRHLGLFLGLIGFALSFTGVTASVHAAQERVRVWETHATIPTYLAAAPSDLPRFYAGRTYQGAKATFYPYPVQDKLTGLKSNVTYRLVYLENDYLQIGVLPELGGRIFSAVDKSNGYNFFYRQHVIKPALIGMLGAWISGGVEWNVPHHHRATSFLPVEYTLRTNADGSATVWVGETELRHRLRWLVGMTLYPDRSFLELNCKIFNRTPLAHPVLFWINAAVHANPSYQVLFPPSTQWAVQHSKPEFASWPIARQWYGGVDYTAGVDISWWKNHPSPVSFFAWNYTDDWFGGYDHGADAGVVHVADHALAPGKKFFTWGTGPEGQRWSAALTDDDGPYLELMAGAWSDNQPDYSWMQPGETREWKHWWYPVRNLGGVVAANREVALNITFTPTLSPAVSNLTIAINATRRLEKAHLLVESRGPRGGNDPLSTHFTVGPGQPFIVRELRGVFGENTLVFSIRPAPNQPPLLVYRHSPAPAEATPMPKPVERPKNPKDYASNDELYYTGQRIEQLHSPSFEAASYYEEMLRRDPGDARAHTALGILLCRQWRWEEAEAHLRAAIQRAGAHYIRPKDMEAHYFLGVAIRGQLPNLPNDGGNGRGLAQRLRRYQEALDMFRLAAWSPLWRAAAALQIAELEAHLAQTPAPYDLREYTDDLTGAPRWPRALEAVDWSLSANPRNPQALKLKSAILRHLGRHGEALEMIRAARQLDPLEVGLFWEELWATRSCTPQSRPPARAMRILWEAVPGAVLEAAMDYGRAKFLDEATQMLLYSTERPEQRLPTVSYLLQNFAGQRGDFEAQAMGRNDRLPGAWGYAFQQEMIPVLQQAHRLVEHDGLAPYLLGCLLYDPQPTEAVKYLKIAAARTSYAPGSANSSGSSLEALCHRALGLALAQHQQDLTNAIKAMERAVQLQPGEPRLWFELDTLYEAAGRPLAMRLNKLAPQEAVLAQRDDALTRLILLYMADGQLDGALRWLTTHRFYNWEGSSEIRNIYVDACLMRGRQRLKAGRAAEALKDFEAALQFPANLGVGQPKRDAKAAAIYYHLALAHQAAGRAEAAREARNQAASAYDGGAASDSRFYRAMALKELGRGDEANPLFESLVKLGQDLQTREPADYFAKFGERRSERVRKADAHFLTGLGCLGLGQDAEAQSQFGQALVLHPAHLGALMHRR